MSQMKELHNKAERWAPEFYKWLVFLFPVCFGVVESWHSVILVALVFMSLFFCWGQWGRTEQDVKTVLVTLFVFLGIASLSLLNSVDFYESQKKLVKLFYLIGFLPLLLASMRLNLDLGKYYISGAMVGSIVMYVTALVQEVGHGVTNPIVFGDIAMLHGVLVLGYFLASPDRRRLMVPATIAIICAFSASFLSLTRGAWIALPFVLLLFLLLFARTAKVKSIGMACLLLLVVCGGTAVFYEKQVSTQFQKTAQSFKHFLDGTNRNSSTGQRFLMWGVAFEMVKDNPILGSGIADFQHDAAVMMAQGETDLSIAHPHAHSIFFEFLGTTGLAGLSGMMLAVMVLPFRYFYRKWRIASSENRGSAVCGMILLTSFFVFGLTECWLSRSPFISAYVVGLFAFFSTYLRTPASIREDQKMKTSERNNLS